MTDQSLAPPSVLRCRDIPWCRCGGCEIRTTGVEAARIKFENERYRNEYLEAVAQRSEL